MLPLGTVLQNRYEIVRLIAEGGMGAVYLARDQRLDSEVALKETLFTDERMSKAFEREARLLARLRHPALPRVSDHFIEENGQFLIMEYIPGEDLAETLKRCGKPFPCNEVLRWADQLLDALEYLHSQEPPIVHRDIKPQNLKLTDRGQVILLDFGLAKGLPLQMTRVTTSGSIFGYTPSYAPMEQIQGVGTDPRSDLYSLAATLYHLIMGATPIDALTRAAAVVEGQPDPLSVEQQLTGQPSSAVARVFQKALSLSRNHRHASAGEMRREMRAASESAIVAGGGVTAVIGSPLRGVIPDTPKSNSAASLVAVEVQGQKQELEHESKTAETVVREEVALEARIKDLIANGAAAFDARGYVLALENWDAALKLSPDEPGVKESIEAAKREIRKEQGRKAQAERLVAEGTEAFDAKKYEAAVRKWNEALALSPHEPGIKKSLESARRAINKEEDKRAKVQELVAAGTEAYDARNYDLAIKNWDDALSLSPREPGVAESIRLALRLRTEILRRSPREVVKEKQLDSISQQPHEIREGAEETADSVFEQRRLIIYKLLFAWSFALLCGIGTVFLLARVAIQSSTDLYPLIPLSVLLTGGLALYLKENTKRERALKRRLEQMEKKIIKF